MVKPRSPEASVWKVNERRNKKPIFRPTFDYLLNKYTKAGPNDRDMKRPRSSMRQEHREQPKQAKPKARVKKIAEERYDRRISQPTYFSHPFGHLGASSSTGFPESQMQWCPPPMMPTHPIWDPYRQIWVNYPPMMPMMSWCWGAPRQPVFERLEFLTNDQVDSSSGQQNIESINEEKAVLKSKIERATADDVIQISTSQVKLDEEFNGPIVINDWANIIMEDVAPDHGEEKIDKVVDSKYLQPRWCPLSLTRTQKRKLQRLCLVEI
jgi:hypothetical protein